MFHTTRAARSIQNLITSENCIVLVPFALKPIIESNENSYFKPQYYPENLVNVLFAEIQGRVKPDKIYACKEHLWTDVHRLVQQGEIRPFFYSTILYTDTITTLTIKEYIDRIPKAVKMKEKNAIFALIVSNLYKIEELLNGYTTTPIDPPFAQQEESLRQEFFATLQDR